MPKATKKTSIKKKVSTVSQKVSVSTTAKTSGSLNLSNILAMVIVVVVAGIVSWGFDIARQNKSNTPAKQAVAAVQSIAYDGQDGKNALDILKSKTQVQTQDSSMGIFVTSINGIENTNNQYWMFYINGELAATASDQYQTKNSDKIEWRYQDIGDFNVN